MIKYWRLHNDYQDFIAINLLPTYINEPSRVKFYADDISKLYLLNLDPLKDLLEPFSSSTGAPAKQQPEIFRFFILMLLLGETSITNWVRLLKADRLLAISIGCFSDSIPSIGSHYAFISSLWLANPETETSRLKKLYTYNRKPSSKSSPGKNKKLPNKSSGIVKKGL